MFSEEPDDTLYAREEVIKWLTINQHDQTDTENITKLTQKIRHEFIGIIGNEATIAGMVRNLRQHLVPQERGIFLHRTIDLLKNEDIPVWRKIGLIRIALRRISKIMNIDITELPIKATNDELFMHLHTMIREKLPTQ